MTIKNWKELKYWQSGEWQVVDEKLRESKGHCPSRSNLFAALKACPYNRTRVCIIGQDPYPNSNHCTGLSFSVPKDTKPLPKSLVNIFTEYKRDLGYPEPSSGDLSLWCERGVLLWNAYPSCEEGQPGSHHWDEWTYLTKEIVNELDSKGGVVFCLLGTCARDYRKYIRLCDCIETSHPSPLGAKYGFLGSSLFTRANEMLVSRSLQPIDWRLP